MLSNFKQLAEGRFGLVTKLVLYCAIAVASKALFSVIAELYVDLFGETLSSATKLLASTISLIVCSLLVFGLNAVSLKLDPKRLGLVLGIGLFVMLYIVGPGMRAPLTLYIASVSFPYNINMIASFILPIFMGRLFKSILLARPF